MTQTKLNTNDPAGPNPFASAHWFPDCRFSEKQSGLSDHVFTDFDQQAEQFTGHDQSYLQLSPGAFFGRFLSGFLGPHVSIHMEFCNQSLEQEVGGPPDHFTFGIVLSTDRPLRVNGQTFASDNMFVMSPGSELHVISPADSTVLAVTIRRTLLLEQPALSPEIHLWLCKLGGKTQFLSIPGLAARLHSDAFCALESATWTKSEKDRSMLGRALAASIAATLSLQWTRFQVRDGTAGRRDYARFRYHRSRLMRSEELSMSEDASSKRLLELAFSRNVSMGPHSYSRIMRLHAARRDLADAANADMRIGDLAARHGFWDWSTFSGRFRRHFGILPSDVRRASRTK